MAKNKSYINEMAVKCIQDAVDDNAFELRGVEPEDISIVKIDKIKIVYLNGKFTMHYDVDVDKSYLDSWRADVGGVYRDDLKTNNVKDYYILTTFGTKTLVKRLDAEKDAYIILKFGETKLIQISDFYYLPIKTVGKDMSFVSYSSSFNNFIKDGQDEFIDIDKEEEVYDEPTYSKEDMDLMNYYIPDNND